MLCSLWLFFPRRVFFFTLLVSPNWVSYLVPSCLSFWSLGCVTPALAGDVKALRAIVNLLINELINFGLGFKHLYTMQEITRIKDLVQHTWENTLTGQLYRASLELFLIEVGIGPNVLDIPSQVVFLATDSLICSTVFFLQLFNIRVHHDITMVPQ